jgi:hypothetical protein
MGYCGDPKALAPEEVSTQLWPLTITSVTYTWVGVGRFAVGEGS